MKHEFVLLKDISQNNTFRISRPARHEILAQSIKELGMLEKPVLVVTSEGYIPYTCHNRIEVLRTCGVNGVESVVIDRPDVDIFIKNAALKVKRGEVGPVGKARTAVLAGEYFGIPDTAFLCKSILNVSAELIHDDFAKNIISMPETLRNYIDAKDIGFKIIRDVVSFPEGILNRLDKWVGMMQLRVNIFRVIVEYLFDLARTMEGDIFTQLVDEEKMDDKKLFSEIFKLRFPAYAALKEDADKLIASTAFDGFTVDYPEYFERDSLTLMLEIKKYETATNIERKLGMIDINNVVKLLAMLS